MRTPTERITDLAQAALKDHDVILGLRIEGGSEAVSSRTTLWSTHWMSAHLWWPMLLPVIGVLRWRQRRRHRDRQLWFGLLALTSTDDRFILPTSPARPKLPTGTIEPLTQGAALLPDVDLMESDLIPTLTIDGRLFVVNGVDFRALLKAVELRHIRSPELKAALPRLQAVGTSQFPGVPHLPD